MGNRQIAAQKARKYHVPVGLFLRQMNQEAHFEDLTSPAGAEGPAQLMPATARSLGVRNPHDPVQAYDAAARLMRQYLNAYHGDEAKALVAYNAGPGAVGKPLPAETRNYLATILGGRSGAQAPSQGVGGAAGGAAPWDVQIGSQATFDRAGFERAQRGALLGALIAKHRGTSSPLFKTGLLTTTAPNPADYVGSEIVSKILKPRGPGAPSSPGGGGRRGGIGTFDGKPVQGWIVPILKRARAAGWKGTVTSGVRTKAQQLAAARRFGLQHYGPAGPLGSNHLAGRGAVDVTDPAGLEQVLRRLGLSGRLKRSMADDPVHFSATGH